MRERIALSMIRWFVSHGWLRGTAAASEALKAEERVVRKRWEALGGWDLPTAHASAGAEPTEGE